MVLQNIYMNHSQMVLVGFTGTPIDSTLSVFGPVVDSYTLTEFFDKKSHCL